MLEMHLHFVSTAASSSVSECQMNFKTSQGWCAVLGLARPARAR